MEHNFLGRSSGAFSGATEHLYPPSVRFALAWFLAFGKSFPSHVSFAVGLFDFVNAKSHAREKPLLAG